MLWNERALINAKNVIPTPEGFRPLKNYVASTSATGSFRIRGAKTFRRTNSALTTIAGAKDKLYKLGTTAISWTDISDAAYTTDEEFGFWSFAQFGTLAIMTNLANPVKKYDIVTAPAAVSSLGGSPPKAAHVFVVKDQVHLAHLENYPNRVQWSAFNDAEGWAVGTNQSDYQDFQDGGRIMSVMGGDVGFVFQERYIRAAQYAPGSPTIYQIDPVDQDRGSAAYQGLIQVGNLAYYLAHDGFFRFDNGVSIPIGSELVDAWFYDNCQRSFVARTVAGIEPKKKLVFWAFISSENADSTVANAFCDKLLIYHWPSKKWAWAAMRVSAFVDVATAGSSVDSMITSIDDMTTESFDSVTWNSDSISSTLAMFGDDYKMGYMAGSNLEALFEIERLEFFPPERQYIRGATLIADASGYQIALASRESMFSSESFDSYATTETNGVCPLHSSGRMHDVRIKIPAATTWNHIRGVYIDAVPDGEL